MSPRCNHRERLYRALAHFHPRSRGCRINLHERIHCHFNALQVGDLMLSEHLPHDRTGLPLDEVCLLPLCAAGHPLAGQEDPITAELLASHNQISLHPPIHRSVDWNDADDTGWKATHYHEVLSMVRLGLGYAWVPGHLVREELASGALVQARSGRRQRALPLHLPAYPLHRCPGPGGRAAAALPAQRIPGRQRQIVPRRPTRPAPAHPVRPSLARPGHLTHWAPASRRPARPAPRRWPP